MGSIEKSILQSLSKLSFIDAFTVSATNNEMDIKAWIASGRYVPVNSHAGIKLQPLIAEEYSSALSNDVLKNGYAFIETIQNLRLAETQNRTAPWVAIKMYYAAFFGAHIFLRMYGRSCSFLDSTVANLCNNEIRNQLGMGSRTVSGGLNLTKLEPTGLLSIVPLKDSHKDTWKSLSDLMSDLETEVNASSSSSTDKLSTIAYLSLLQDKFRLGAAGPMAMSEFRNKVNYQYKFNIWHPGRRNAKTFLEESDAGLRSLCKRYVVSSNPTTELAAFVDSAYFFCNAVIEIIRVNVERANTRNTKMTMLNARINQILS